MQAIRQLITKFYFNVILKILRLIPFLNVVKGAHPKLMDWMRQQGAQHRVIELFPAEPIQEKMPVVAIPDMPKRYREEYASHTHGPIVVSEIKWGRVAGKYTDVLSPDGFVFRDMAIMTETNKQRTRSEMLPYLPPLQKKSGAYGVFCTFGGLTNYWHWVGDCLTRLWALEQTGEDYTLIVPAMVNRYQREFLDLLIPESRRAYFGEENWAVERLLVPSFTYAQPTAPTHGARWLREKLLAAVPVADKPLPERVFISRAGAAWRRLVNEDEIFAILEPLGFTSVRTENLSVSEQIQLFRQAKIVVSLHGAGLANVLFMPQDSLLIEFQNWRRERAHFWSLANSVGVAYAVVSDEGNPNSGVAPHRDTIIEPERVRQALDKLGISA